MGGQRGVEVEELVKRKKRRRGKEERSGKEMLKIKKQERLYK